VTHAHAHLQAGRDPETLEFPRPIEPQARVRALGALYMLGGPLNRPVYMPSEIAKLTEEAEIAQASYEVLLNVYELSSGIEKIRLLSRVTSALMRRDETLAALGAALRAQ
jgi:hypothetical protein